MPLSIKDIARLAGVSHSTVSRALRNSPLIPACTTQRIQEIAESAGYTANAIGRSLATSKTEAIGVVVTSIADPFNGEVVDGIEEFANQHGFTVILASSHADPAREVAVVRSFQARRVDGILVASSRLGAVHTELLSEVQIPIVLLNNQHPSTFAHSVRFDDFAGGLKVTQHLIGLGHKKIAFLGDKFGLASNSERYGGYSKALKDAGIPEREALVVLGDGKPDTARTAAKQLLSLPDRPTAIVCYNDMSALGAVHQAALQQVSVPEELSVTGFDDIFFASFLSPPLTTIRQPKRELGRRAMKLLFDLLSGKETERDVLVQGELAVRGSTAAAKESSGKHKGSSYQSILSGKNSATKSS